MAESTSSPFVMHGAREAVGAGLVHIEQQVHALEVAVAENPGLAFDLAKTLIESVCRAVLGERSVAYDEKDVVPKLFKAVSSHVPFLPASASGEAEARKSLAQTLNGLSTAIQGICELRNRCGFASHGSGSPRPAMDTVQALMAAEAADTIVGFLHRVHRQDQVAPPLAGSRARTDYETNSVFNDSVDDVHGMFRVFEVEFRPSEVLFHLEPESYRVYLAEFEPDANGGGESGRDDDGAAEGAG